MPDTDAFRKIRSSFLRYLIVYGGLYAAGVRALYDKLVISEEATDYDCQRRGDFLKDIRPRLDISQPSRHRRRCVLETAQDGQLGKSQKENRDPHRKSCSRPLRSMRFFTFHAVVSYTPPRHTPAHSLNWYVLLKCRPRPSRRVTPTANFGTLAISQNTPLQTKVCARYLVHARPRQPEPTRAH